MGTLKQDTTYIYESPDGGHTVYARELNKTERFLVGISLDKQKQMAELKDEELWKDIRKESENNETLQKAMEHCIVLYHISKNGR